MKEKLESITDHLADIHHFPENSQHKQCCHGELEAERNKAWLDPDSLVSCTQEFYYFLFLPLWLVRPSLRSGGLCMAIRTTGGMTWTWWTNLLTQVQTILISWNSSELALANFRRDWKLQLSHQQVLCQEVFIQVANFVLDDVRHIWVLFQPLVHAHPYCSGCHWPQPEHRQGAEGDGWWQAHVCPPQAEAWEEVLCEGNQGWEGLRLEKHPGILDCQGRVG